MPPEADPDDAAPPDARFSALARFGRFRLDRATGRVDWSAEVYELFGYDPADGPPSLAMALAAFPDEAQAQLRAGLAESWETGAEVSIAAPIERRDGGRRDVLVRLRADPSAGAPRRTLSGILLDVTGARAFDARIERERALLSTTLDNMDQGVLVVRPDMSVPVLSRRVTELLSLPAAFVDSRPRFPDILAYQRETGTIPPEMVSSSINAYILELADLPETHVYERETVDGRTLEVRTSRLPDGGFVRTFTDQTARRRREAEAARAEAEYRLLFENSIIGIYRATPDGRPVRANPALVAMNGYASEAEMLAAVGGDPGAEWSVDPRRPRDFLDRLFAEGRVADYVSEIYRHRTRERLWISESAWVIRDAAGAIVAFEGTIVDVSARKRAEDRIAHMARQDALTGLPNRLAFSEGLEAALAAPGAAPLAVMLLDLDRFKAVNDTLGHPAGDALLQALAARIAALLGPGEMVARFGGDELALLAVGADRRAAAALAGRVLAALRAPVAVSGRAIAAGASIGVALAPEDGADPTELIRAADIALYRAKDAGGAGFRFFAPSMDPTR